MARARARLYERGWFGVQLGLGRMREALDRLGRPEASMRVVHVGGTNGKGSVCAMVESIARQAGLRTGLSTSPHLEQLRERVRIDGADIDDLQLDDALAQVLDVAPDDLTFFETVIAASLVAMRDAAVDVAILEVGLGGRLDATNAVEAPVVAAITTIGTDHTAELGPTVSDIAAEKAGILDAGLPWVLGPVSGAAREAIFRVAATVSAPTPWQIVAWGDPPAASHVRQRPTTEGVELAGAAGDLRARLGLAGAHQAGNAAVAAAVVRLGLPEITLEHVARGLAAARWPGRLEARVASRGGRRVDVLLDCAHNAEGADALARHLERLPRRPAAMVFGALQDKPVEAMLGALGPYVERVILTEGPSGRSGATPVDALALAWPDGLRQPDPAQALAAAVELARDGDTVVVAGSIYLVGALRCLLDPPG